MPSFGDWGFNMALQQKHFSLGKLPDDLKFLTPELWKTFLVFPKDIQPMEVHINTLDKPNVFYYYKKGWLYLY